MKRSYPLLIALLLFALAVPTASAGEYVVYSCKSPDGRPAPTDGWSATGSTPFGTFGNDCAAGGSLHAELGGSSQPASTSFIGWGFDSGGAPIRGWTIHRSGRATAGGYNATALLFSANAQNDPGGGRMVDYCVTANGCQVLGVPSQGMAPANQIRQSASTIGTDSRAWFISVGCGSAFEGMCTPIAGATNLGSLAVHAAAFTLGDDSAPSAGGASGSLTEPGAVSGTINFTAQDTWSGIFRASLLVDGQPIVSSTPNENGGRCVTLGLAGATRDFNYRRPCPATQQVELALPPGSMVAGRHELRVTVEDAAGNTATAFGPRRVDVTKEQATASSTATARFIPDKSGSFITTFGMSKRIAGKLVDAAGSPIPASAVEVEMTSDSAVRRRSVRRLTTGSDGRWAITVPGTASRKVEFTHVATGASLEKRVKVRSRIQLRAARSRVAAFGRMRLIGRLPSEKARRGASVEIQARGPRGWRTVSVRRLARSGRFAMTYRFRRTAHAKFRFRAVVRASSDLTVTPQRSRTVRVRVG